MSRVILLVLAASAAPGVADSSPRLVPGELLIKYRADADVGAAARTALTSELGAVTLHRFPFIGVEHVKLGGMTVEDALARLRPTPISRRISGPTRARFRATARTTISTATWTTFMATIS